jgi:hypothetical protein
MALLCGRLPRHAFISVLAALPSRDYSDSELRQDLSNALADFSLTGTTLWGCPEPAGGTA